MTIQSRLKSLFKNVTKSDWIFISLSLIALAGFYLFFKRDVTYITARFKVTDENILYAFTSPTNEFASSFMVGDAERDELGRVVSEIIRVKSYKIKPDQRVVYLDIKLKAIYNPRTNQYTVRGKKILFGESLTFSFSKVTFKAVVVDFPGFRKKEDIQQTTTKVTAQLRYESREFSDIYGVPDFVAASVKKGDIVQDTEGTTLVKILDVFVAPAKRVVVSSSGQSVVSDDPYLKDVNFILELATTVINGTTYMYDYIPVLINVPVPINTNTISIFPVIKEIIE